VAGGSTKRCPATSSSRPSRSGRPGSRIFREEVFGRAGPVSTANSLAEALEIANGVEYGLAASIFTQDIDYRAAFSWRGRGWHGCTSTSDGGARPAAVRRQQVTGVGEREMSEEGRTFSLSEDGLVNYRR